MVTFILHWFTSSRSSYVADKLRNVHMYLKLIGLIHVLPEIYVLNISDVTGQSHFEAPLGAATSNFGAAKITFGSTSAHSVFIHITANIPFILVRRPVQLKDIVYFTFPLLCNLSSVLIPQQARFPQTVN